MAYVGRLNKDLAIISKLSDYPGGQDGLSTEEFKAKFDEAALAIQDHINNVIAPAIEEVSPEEGAHLPLSGGVMTGAINMNGRKVTNLAEPTNDGDATRKSYVDEKVATALPKTGGTMAGNISMGSKMITNLAAPTNNNDAANKGYVDGKHLTGTVVLSNTWSGNEREVAVSGIKSTDMPHWCVVYGTNKEAEKEAFALIDELETQDGKFIFRCFGDVPAVALTIQWEVNR